MKWQKIVETAVANGASSQVLNETVCEMQKLLDFVMETEPELYFDFKSCVLAAVNGNCNNGFMVDDDDEFAVDSEGCE